MEPQIKLCDLESWVGSEVDPYTGKREQFRDILLWVLADLVPVPVGARRHFPALCSVPSCSSQQVGGRVQSDFCGSSLGVIESSRSVLPLLGCNMTLCGRFFGLFGGFL